MSHFTLTTGASVGTTSISNIFLDEYMPGANGEYVKVYLYLVRSLGDSTRELSVIGLADVLDCTESDILRAFKYWEKQGLLKLECNASNVLLGIYLCEPSHLRTIGQPDRQASVATPGSSPVVPSVASASAVPERKAYSRDQLREFTSQSDCRQLLFVCEQYMKKTLTPSEIETLLYFYDQLHFSVDLVEYLVEYCVCKGSSSIHYIEKVGLAWAEAGITTVSQAKERTTTYRRNTFAIMKAFGINDRNPVQPELDYIEKWLGTYDFTLDLVLEACRRTMDRLHKPNFDYADKILQSWSEKKVHTLADVERLDQEHQKKNSTRKKPSAARATGFTNFQQRDYDFDKLEEMLLQSQK